MSNKLSLIIKKLIAEISETIPFTIKISGIVFLLYFNKYF
ncbi:hypothetical protein J2S08_002105 [Bacillus chungangensis]|uniref:Uncharacterized protein n=1 Tax=Bacillus chungangensis TaxID=587633 RepID=A0ABT9WT01_9BACI|nr:hypothetical protein [Bacillus chungangensis]